MGQTTIFCLLAVLALAQAMSQSKKVMDSSTQTVSTDTVVQVTPTQHSTQVTSTGAVPHSTSVASPSAQLSSSSSNAPAKPTSSVSRVSSPQKSQMSTPSVTATVVHPTHSKVQSATPSPSQIPTPSLSSAAMSSHPVVHISSPVPPKSTPVKPFITPSGTVQTAYETVKLYDKHRKLCLFAGLEVDFVISYNALNTTGNGTATNTSGITKKTTIPLNGVNATINTTGSCSFESGTAHFRMMWNEHGDIAGPQHKFEMYFEQVENGTHWVVPKVNAVFNTSDHSSFIRPEKKELNANASGHKFFGVQKNHTNYMCTAEQDLNMGSSVTAKFTHVILQPFSSNENHKSNGFVCSKDKSGDDNDDNTVPIAVGAALGGLVLIVLIAYIIGRRRSTSGYEQV